MSCLAWGSGVLVSGSWDHSGRIWTNWECSHELKGHEGPLWSVVVLPSESSSSTSILTASADKTIKLWREGKVCLSICDKSLIVLWYFLCIIPSLMYYFYQASLSFICLFECHIAHVPPSGMLHILWPQGLCAGSCSGQCHTVSLLLQWCHCNTLVRLRGTFSHILWS